MSFLTNYFVTHTSYPLRYNRICSDNLKLDQCCNDLEKWQMERDFSARMASMQMLKARGESRGSFLERENTRTPVSKLTFNISCYTGLQKVRSILQEFQTLLAPDCQIPIAGSRNGKRLEDYLVSAALPKINNAGDSEPYGKGTCQVCDHIINTNTFCCMGKLFKVGIHSFFIFVLRRTNFCFCLF